MKIKWGVPTGVELLLNFGDELRAGYDKGKLVMHAETDRLEEAHM